MTMGYALLGRPKNVAVTRTLAAEWRDLTPAPADRPLSAARIAVYRKLVSMGLFRPSVEWAKAHCAENGGLFRVNGKHTSTLLADLDQMPDGMTANVQEYQCDTMDDVARLYSTFDSRDTTRTANDVTLAFAAVDEDLSKIGLRVVSLAVTGIALHRHGPRYASDTRPAERAEALLDPTCKQFVLWLDGIFSGKRTRHIQRGGVVAAMFGTWLRCRKDATAFWVAVVDETGATPGAPDRRLARYLLTHSVNSGNGARRGGTTRASAREIQVKSIHAWNAWRAGTTTDLKYHASAKLPAIK